MAKKKLTLKNQIHLIAKAVNDAKATRIRRIVRQLERMSPKDVQALERLLGTR